MLEAEILLLPYLSIALVAFVGSLIATPVMRSLARRHGVVDWPDLLRKQHRKPVAYLGGVAIFLGWFAGVVYALTLPAGLAAAGALLALIVGAGAIHLTGLIDDVATVRARVKIGGQLFAAAALASQDIGIDLSRQVLMGFHFPLYELHRVATPLTGVPLDYTLCYILGTVVVAVFVIGFCNAVNLIDGLDGLAAGTTAISMTGVLGLALLVIAQHVASQPSGSGVLDFPHVWDSVRLVLCLATIGTLLGFLVFNWNPASVFMGDAGSLLLGFLYAAAVLSFSDTGGASLHFVIASLVTFGIPITDTSLAILRRKLRGYPIFAPDSQHLHHMLRRAGFTVKQSVGVMYVAAVLLAMLGLTIATVQISLSILVPLLLAGWFGLLVLGFKVSGYQLRQEAEAVPEAAGDAAPATA